MTDIARTPIVKSRHVPLSPAEAFDLFTRDIDAWWPGQVHSVSAATGRKPRRLRIEPHKGGRILEETADGNEAVWGTITGWEPGRYLSMTWHPGRPEAEATIVSITFKADGAGCVVELTHGGFDILGPLADAVSTSWLRGWKLVLGCYITAIRLPELVD